uniref:Intraflagellar transport 25 n=1 Tax=Ficedula albicollis TaxID=59894 RepID=A0A803W853_FICAL
PLSPPPFRPSASSSSCFSTPFPLRFPPSFPLHVFPSKTFWTTTGMFPQELIIGFPKCVKISKVTIQCYLVRTLRIERSTSKDPVGFQQCVEKDLQHREGQLQMEEFPVSIYSVPTYLRFIIKSAFDHFVSVHRLKFGPPFYFFIR